MTREEAIKVLNTYDVNFDEYRAEEIAEAIDMAIEALSAEPSGDLISRADAIEAVRLETSKLGRGLLGRGDILDIIEALPSADAVQGDECDHCVYKWGMKGGDGE